MPLSEYQKSRLAHIEAGRPDKKKERKPLRKVSLKKQAKNEEMKAAGVYSEMNAFFENMLKRCRNKCLFCGGPTLDVKLYKIENPKWSKEANEKAWEREEKQIRKSVVAHLLPKRSVDKGGFPSVSKNENNWIELCIPCHHSFDSGKISWQLIRDSKEWDVIAEKLHEILPAVAEEERKNKLYSRLCDLLYKK